MLTLKELLRAVETIAVSLLVIASLAWFVWIGIDRMQRVERLEADFDLLLKRSCDLLGGHIEPGDRKMKCIVPKREEG